MDLRQAQQEFNNATVKLLELESIPNPDRRALFLATSEYLTAKSNLEIAQQTQSVEFNPDNSILLDGVIITPAQILASNDELLITKAGNYAIKSMNRDLFNCFYVNGYVFLSWVKGWLEMGDVEAAYEVFDTWLDRYPPDTVDEDFASETPEMSDDAVPILVNKLCEKKFYLMIQYMAVSYLIYNQRVDIIKAQQILDLCRLPISSQVVENYQQTLTDMRGNGDELWARQIENFFQRNRRTRGLDDDGPTAKRRR